MLLVVILQIPFSNTNKAFVLSTIPAKSRAAVVVGNVAVVIQLRTLDGIRRFDTRSAETALVNTIRCQEQGDWDELN